MNFVSKPEVIESIIQIENKKGFLSNSNLPRKVLVGVILVFDLLLVNE